MILSREQKRQIAMAAHKAWAVCAEREALLAVNSEMAPTKVEEAWRHVEQGKAVGIQSLRLCDQSHFGRLIGHFLKLAGDEAGSTHMMARDQDNARRIAFFKLEENLRERGLEMSYAAKICWQQNKCAITDATEKQLWRLVYTVRSRKKPIKKTVAAGDDENPF